MNRRDTPRLAVYWAASCGGCEVTLLNLGDKLLLLERFFDLAFCPCLTDVKRHQIADCDDGSIDLCLFNGAIRNDENEEMARLLRRKSKLLVAFGSCAHEGCIPALANLTTTPEILDAVYRDGPSTHNPDRAVPQRTSAVAEGTLSLPALHDTVRALHHVVAVDLVVPGCPPEPERVWSVLELLVDTMVGGAEAPPAGSVLGAGSVALCEECPLERTNTAITRFLRPHEVVPQPQLCLLDQGLVCMGVATRSGCGALCPRAGMGCRGCYGPLPGVADLGAKLVSALASVINAGGGLEHEESEAALAAEIDRAMASLADPAGTLYRFGMAGSLLLRARTKSSQGEPE